LPCGESASPALDGWSGPAGAVPADIAAGRRLRHGRDNWMTGIWIRRAAVAVVLVAMSCVAVHLAVSSRQTAEGSPSLGDNAATYKQRLEEAIAEAEGSD